MTIPKATGIGLCCARMVLRGHPGKGVVRSARAAFVLAFALGALAPSRADLWDTVTNRSWFRGVYADVAKTERLLTTSTTPIAKDDVWHRSNLIVESDDPQYLSRAAKNNASTLDSTTGVSRTVSYGLFGRLAFDSIYHF